MCRLTTTWALGNSLSPNNSWINRRQRRTHTVATATKALFSVSFIWRINAFRALLLLSTHTCMHVRTLPRELYPAPGPITNYYWIKIYYIYRQCANTCLYGAHLNHAAIYEFERWVITKTRYAKSVNMRSVSWWWKGTCIICRRNKERNMQKSFGCQSFFPLCGSLA